MPARPVFAAAPAAAIALVTVLSSCASLPQATGHPDFTGIWSGFLTTQESPYWGTADALCFPGCPAVFHEQLAATVATATKTVTVADLRPGAIAAAVADRIGRSTPEGLARIQATATLGSVDLAAYCKPYGFVREALNALPLAIHAKDNRLVIQYEEFGLSRDIWMDGRKHPQNLAPTPLGHSIGRYEGSMLIVETVAIAADQLVMLGAPNLWWGGFADGTTAVERYSIEEDPRRLVVDLTITDPVTLTKPYLWTKTWLFTPDVELIEDSCEEVPGQL
ncbi:MAG: hypothetical protein ABI859_18105 [Pseudomonadota bacterium]